MRLILVKHILVENNVSIKLLYSWFFMNAFLLCFHGFCFQASPIVVGTTIGAAALGARYLIRAWQTFKAAPRVRRFYPGGFEQVMTRREAALILGVRYI